VSAVFHGERGEDTSRQLLQHFPATEILAVEQIPGDVFCWRMFTKVGRRGYVVVENAVKGGCGAGYECMGVDISMPWRGLAESFLSS
jgi:hypothetical protein